jgi:hypothetical protein
MYNFGFREQTANNVEGATFRQILQFYQQMVFQEQLLKDPQQIKMWISDDCIAHTAEPQEK